MWESQVIGHLAADAESRDVGKNKVVNFRIGVNHGTGDDQTTSWISISCWGDWAQNVLPFLLKGKKVFVSGQLKTRVYMNKKDEEATSIELNCHGPFSLRLLSPKDEDSGSTRGSGGGSGGGKSSNKGGW